MTDELLTVKQGEIHPMAKQTAAKNDNDTLTFEQAMKRLEEIVQAMEEGSLSLEKMTDAFEEGTKLVRYCDEKLSSVENRIEKLVKKDNTLTTEPFEAEKE
jgi:exodeoxyribonuclease VII small subunit